MKLKEKGKRVLRKLIWAPIILTILLWTGGCGLPPTPIELIKPPLVQENTDNSHNITLFASLLPAGARILIPEQSKANNGVSYGDIDGDGVDEAVIVYEEGSFNDRTLKAALLKKHNDGWHIVWDTEGFGYGIDYREFSDVNGDGFPEILLGWSFGAGGNGLDIYGWQDNAVKLLSKKGYDSESDLSGQWTKAIQ
ncbi:hypothetical protein FHS15_000510 [Paenibacillus castaneae]|uniref:FG-GAP repeat protein n=1 Tax=Paenibacillus castaneae TaxID=474957 RepID=UPI001ABA1C8D|nr:FG-GAP repeat protein [Paenibacillus castaneae]NIK75412.1 hypothetical protein [Paenibacillus castaneae]